MDDTNSNQSKSTRESPQPLCDQPGNANHLSLRTPDNNNNNNMRVNQNPYCEMEDDNADDHYHIDDDDADEFSQDALDDLLGNYADYPNLLTTDNSTATRFPTVVEEEPSVAIVLSPSGFFLTTTSMKHANQPPT
jgi:hypothetical protein